MFRSISASLTSRVCGAGKCSITAGSAFSAANGSRSDVAPLAQQETVGGQLGHASLRRDLVDRVVAGGPQVLDRVGTPRPPRTRVRRSRVWGPQASLGHGPRTGYPDRWPRRRPGHRAPASRSTRPSTARSRAARPVARAPCPSRCRRPGRSPRAASVAIKVVSVVRRDFGNASVSGSSPASACIVGNRCVSPPPRPRSARRAAAPADARASAPPPSTPAGRAPRVRRTPRRRPCAAPGGPAPSRSAARAPDRC